MWKGVAEVAERQVRRGRGQAQGGMREGSTPARSLVPPAPRAQVSTKGLSFKHVEVDGGTPFILLDSEGAAPSALGYPGHTLRTLSCPAREGT